MKVLLKGCKRKKRQKRKPKRRKKKVVNDKFFNTSRLFLFLLLLKGRCQINHISIIGPLQRINSNFLKSIPCCFHMGITCTVNFGVCYFYNNTTIPKKNNVANHDNGKVMNHTKNVAVKLFFSPSLCWDTLTKHSNLCLIYYTNTLIWLL